MKTKTTLTTLILLLIFSWNVKSQNQTGKAEGEPGSGKNYFYFSPLSPLFKSLQFAYERKLGHQKGIWLNPGFIYYEDNDIEKRGIRAEAQFRLYLYEGEKKWKQGIYLGPALHYKYSETRGSYIIYNYDSSFWERKNFGAVTLASIGVILGANFTHRNGFVVDAFLGGGMQYSDKSKISYNREEWWENYSSGPIWKIGILVGFNK